MENIYIAFSKNQLVDNAASIAKANGLTIGKPLTKEQIANIAREYKIREDLEEGKGK